MNSKRPDLTTASTQLEVGAGNLESYEVFGVHNQPLSDSTAFRVAGSYQTQDEGYVTAPNMPDGKVNTQNSYDLRASLLTTPNDKLSVLVRMSYSKVNADCCDGANLGDSTFLLPSGERDSNEDYDRSSFFTYPGTTKPVSDSDALSAVVDVTYDWGDVALRSITAYVDSSADLLLDYNLQGLILVQHLDSDQLSQEFQFQGKALADRLSWLVGAYYFTDDNQWFTSLGFPATGVSLGSEDLDTGADAYALFTNMNYAITDQLEAVVGLRYTNETKDISATGYSDLYGTVGPIWDDQTLEANGVPLDQDFSRLDPKVGLNYHFTADIMGYISWSQAFQSGGWSARVWANPNSFSAVGEQTVDATEIGVKALLLDDRLRFNAAVFWNDYDDIVVNRLEFLPNGALGTIAANAATASANGIELEAQFKISETLLATGSYSYIDSKIESVEGDTGFVTVGDPLDSTPESQFSLALEGNWPVSALSGSLTGRLGYSHTSLYFNGSAAEPVQQIPSLGLLDVTAGYESDDGWYAQAYCHNCSDEEYWQSRFSIGPYYPAYVGMPRTYGMRVGMRF
jgi:iron complex outermembrane receptor protein